MCFSSVLISSSLASVVLAAQFFGNTTMPAINSIWAGNIFTLEGSGAVQHVSSTIHAPNITGHKVGSSGVALVGIDGTGDCIGGRLQVGIMFNVTTKGPSYSVVYRYGNKYEGHLTDVHIAAGNAIKLTVSAPVNATQGCVKVENFSNNQNSTQQFDLTERLCGKTAEWVVERLVQGDSKTPLVNFGTLTFADTQVGGNDFGMQKTFTVDVIENFMVFTSVSVDDDSVNVTYL